MVIRGHFPALRWLVAWVPEGNAMQLVGWLGSASASVQVLKAASGVHDSVYTGMKKFNKTSAFFWARVWAYEKDRLPAALGLL